MDRKELIDRGATEEEADLLCPKCGCSVLRISMGIIDFTCLGYYDPSDKSFHAGGEACETISKLRKKISKMEEELDAMIADRVRLQTELDNAQREVRRAWKRAANLWDGYDALKDFLDDESEDARDRSYSHLADHFAERVIEARQNLAKHPRPREDQLSLQPPAGSP